MCSVAGAESPATLPAGSTTVYGGLGVSTWRWGMSGNRRDPAAIGRVDAFAAHGLSDRTELRGSLPLLASWIVDDPSLRPCPTTRGQYCDGVVAPGALDLGVRWRAVDTVFGWTLAAGVRGDPWLAPTRTRYLNVGQGVVGPTVGTIVGATGDHVGVVVASDLWGTPGRAVPGTDRRAPAPTVTAALELQARTGPVWWSASTQLVHRLGGVDYGPAYLRDLYPTSERWGVVRFGQASVGLKASIAVSDMVGVHVAASRPYWTRNGPRDLTDGSVGVHRWIP